MLDLANAEILGRGSSRVCYVHPEDGTKCVKVVFRQPREVLPEEMKYYRRFQQRGRSWEMVARMYGTVETTAGRGVVFSLARDDDGAVSKTLDHYIRAGGIDAGMLAGALLCFRRYLQREHFVVRELKADNLVYQKRDDGQGKIVLVDGLGNNEFLPLADYSRLFAWRMHRRKWRKFKNSLLQHYPGNCLASALFDSL
ncbi:hypothetical protein INT08_06285 [Prosthecochloris sp. N3]|uniref:PhoP regulatory network protein YrbL n=1 Tax=Prosthecochloris ethylica TaxID=2743976 RepID=A0ABR9XRZ0_9CHLB|nr:YrbL family protein [Prosthecochloris ethylica]MBF0586869.1 hypothetical protein [Prosthecochloris ethylica]MBF0636783.1 hypothetical protein [Prosthecochloris ethylica]NUK47999.1 hypothetical protein [Prosthecochloris ethylica]